MQISYFQPKDTYINQVMMCFYNEKYYIYYQCDDTRLPQDAGGSQGWNLAVTEDLEHYEVHQMVLKSDAEAGRRKTLRAGNVVIREERFYACYSVQAGTDAQIVTAVSEDGIHWTVAVQQLVLPPECDDKFEAMPSLFYEKETKKWLLTVSAEKKGPEAAYRGCILQYQSGDFITWTEREMLWSPMRYEKIERPAFFTIGKWQYLLYSEHCDEGKIHYRKRQNGETGWSAPRRGCLDGRCLEMGGVFSENGHWRLYGILPIRKINSELGDWSDCGGVLVHRIVQQENGDLSVLPIEEKETQLSGVSALTLENIQGNAELVFAKQTGTRYRVDFMMEFSELTYRFGVKIYENSAIDSGYAYQFVPGEQKAEFDRLPNMKWFIYLNKGMAQSVSLIPGKKYPVTVLVQDDISVLYVDGVAISARMKEKPGDELKFYVESGKLTVSEITLDREAVK